MGRRWALSGLRSSSRWLHSFPFCCPSSGCLSSPTTPSSPLPAPGLILAPQPLPGHSPPQPFLLAPLTSILWNTGLMEAHPSLHTCQDILAPKCLCLAPKVLPTSLRPRHAHQSSSSTQCYDHTPLSPVAPIPLLLCPALSLAPSLTALAYAVPAVRNTLPCPLPLT